MNFYRKIIALIDETIIMLISWRMKVVLKIERWKRKNNLPISFPEIEQKKLSMFREIARKKSIDPEMLEKVFKAIMSESVVVQEKQRNGSK